MRQLFLTVGLIAVCSATAMAQTAPKRVQSEIALAIVTAKPDKDARENEKAKLVLHYTVDPAPGARPRRFTTSNRFSASEGIFLTYPRFNPLRERISATITESDDPTAAAIARLISTMTDTVAIVRPRGTLETVAAAPLPTCPALTRANRIAGQLRAQLETGVDRDAVLATLKSWQLGIDRQPGPAGIAAAVTSIQAFATDIRTRTAEGQRLVNELIEALRDPFKQNDTCESLGHLTLVVALQDNPTARITKLEALARSMTGLATALGPLRVEDAWQVDATGQRTHYLIATIAPTTQKIQDVEIKAARLSFDVEPTGLVAAEQPVERASLSVQLHRRITAEIGVGVVFSELRRPKYGTGLDDAGKTIIAREKDEAVSFDPAVLANLIWRVENEIAAPMLQLGALPSKDSPGFFAGAGVRLFGEKGLSLSYGRVFAWVRDLDPEKVGQQVTGTKAIEDALTFRSRKPWYFAIAYKF